ncbi:protein SPA1-RELATED 3 [Artemisia annua]|uniref:Protein SPA1-RELATED 3 n=1 Tax=Artemisia annua TaxID=35608 RepID=A0A2U1NIN7_ARTAN|nr:protein SPA1-RELATED 3 [Artemisia annua]
MKMDKNSSEFGYQISGTSRGLNSSEASNRNPIDLELNRVRTQFGYFREDGGAVIRPVDHKDVSLRQWLDDKKRNVDAFECLHIFTQIVEIVNLAHSQGIVVQNVRPSCFVMSSLKRVSFIESASCSDSDTESNMVSDTSWLQSSLDNVDTSCFEQSEEKKPCFPMKRILEMENDWYTSPEEASGLSSSCASDIYRLGALLFELYCTCSSAEEKYATMSNLRHRVFPPHLLLKWPKEALFCLWLLHPESASRPKIDEVLQSEFLTKLKDNLDERVAVIDIKEKIEEQELLLEFLLMMQHRKQEAADSLRTTISVLTSDLEEVMKLHSSVNKKEVSSLNLDDCASSRSRKRIHQTSEDQESSIFKSPRLMKNFKKLESAYFLTRKRAGKQSRWINSFMDGICKYLTYSKLKVKADLNQVDLLSSSNLVCSLSFDRDGEFFATAGVNKKIKVFEYDSILNGNHDIHYPVVEMGSGSKLSSICWNRYVKGQIASSNFDGVVQVWDVTRSQVFMEMREHERRAWSVDFSSADPKLLASGSDDGSVKLWNIYQGVTVGTIKTKANVCCVQFPTDSSNSLAFGSADHRIYYYDLIRVGHFTHSLDMTKLLAMLNL